MTSDECLIGHHVVFINDRYPAAVIGEGALVGARSVVAKDVEPCSVVADNPARLAEKLSAGPSEARAR